MGPIAVVGLDGASWDVILPLVETGRLPVLRQLMRGGSWGKLRSIVPPLSPPAWVSFMTGANPGKTRVFDFVGRTDNGDFRLVNGQWRALPSLWRLLSDAGLRVAVVNVPMTYPPEPVNGVLIAGMDAPIKDKAIGYPENIGWQLRSAGLPYRVEVHPSRLIRQSPERFFHAYVRQVNRVAREHGAVARWLWERLQPDFLMVTLVSTDRISHAAGRFLKDFVNAERVASLPDDHPIVAVYRTADEELGRLLDVLPASATVIVMSDHGFQPYDQVFNLNFWLKEAGWLYLDERKLHASRLGPLAPLWKRLQYRFGGYSKRNLLTQAAFFQAIDWSRTRAYSLGAFGSIFVNLKGRDPYGIVEPGREYEKVLETLSRQLLAVCDPSNGERIVRAVHRAAGIYSGPHVKLGPDLLLETEPGYFIRNVLDEYQPHLLYPAGRYGDRSLEHTGMHHPDGIVLLHGPGVFAGSKKQVSILDLMPTVLARMGLPVPSYVDGHPLTDWFSPPLEWKQMDLEEEKVEGLQGYSHGEEALIAEHLRELGYL